MKNLKQDDAVERMLNELEGLLKQQQHPGDEDVQHADTPLDGGSSDERDNGNASQPGVDRDQRDAQGRFRVQELLGKNGELDVPATDTLEEDPQATRPEMERVEPDATAREPGAHVPDHPAPEIDAGDPESPAPEMDTYDPDSTAPEMDAHDPDTPLLEMDAYDPDTPLLEMDKHDPDPVERALDAYGADPAAAQSDEDEMTVASKPDTELLAEPEERPQPAAPFAPEQADGAHMTRRLTTRLGQLLLDANLLSQSKLQSALERQKETGQRLGELLVTEGYIDEAALLPVLESQYGVPAAELDSVNLDADLATVITHDMAQRYLLVPLTLHADAVDVAMVDPTDFVAMAHVRFATGLRPNVFITTVTAAQRAIARLYGEPDTDTAEHPRDPREVVKQMILDRDSMLIAADQDPRKFYELAASIDLFVDEIFRNVNGS